MRRIIDTTQRKAPKFLKFHFFICLFLLTSCDQTFQPIQNSSNSPFSMYGYLDASADTQIVRITPLQNQLSTITQKPAMQVTLEDLDSEATQVMKDSLQFFYMPSGYTALNSSATIDLDFGHSYRLIAERTDGASSSVTVTIPPDFPQPTLTATDLEGCLLRLEVSGVERLADVQYRMRMRIMRPDLRFEKSYSVPLRGRMNETAPGQYETSFNLLPVRRGILNRLRSLPARTSYEILEKHFFIASGGPGWIGHEELQSINDLEYAVPSNVSNVENGVGYMIGIVSKTIPDTTCGG